MSQPSPAADTLESAFFHPEDAKLVSKLAELRNMEDTKQALSDVSGIKNDRILGKLVALKVRPEIAAALVVVPLIEVAWADGKVDDKERAAVLAKLADSGVKKGGIEHEIAQSWLLRRPKPQLLEAWTHYVEGLVKPMSPTEREALRTELLNGLTAVAEASGGFAGIRKISASESEMVAKLKVLFLAAK
jgi:hypothetical protein